MSQKGDEILLRARQKFREQRTIDTLRKIEVPEWDAVIYYWPVRDMDERLAIEGHVPIGAKVDQTAADVLRVHIAQVCCRARDEMGNRLWSDESAKALADTWPTVIERISSEMGMHEGVTLEEAEGN